MNIVQKIKPKARSPFYDVIVEYVIPETHAPYWVFSGTATDGYTDTHRRTTRADLENFFEVVAYGDENVNVDMKCVGVLEHSQYTDNYLLVLAPMKAGGVVNYSNHRIFITLTPKGFSKIDINSVVSDYIGIKAFIE